MQLAFPDPALAAAEMTLRRPEFGDIPWIARACSDGELSRYIPVIPYPYSQSDARAFVERSAQGWAAGNNATFVIARAAGGDCLGTIGLHPAPGDAGLAEVGYCCALLRAGMARQRSPYGWCRTGPLRSWALSG